MKYLAKEEQLYGRRFCWMLLKNWDNAMANKYLAYAFKNSVESDVRPELDNPRLLMNLNTVYSKINRINSEKERIRHINNAINFWESYISLSNDNDNIKTLRLVAFYTPINKRRSLMIFFPPKFDNLRCHYSTWLHWIS